MAPVPALQQIPGVGPSIGADLEELGFREISDLKGQDPARMYLDLCDLHGFQDRCVLYVFRSSVYFAETERPEPELTQWWNWKDRVHANEKADFTAAGTWATARAGAA